MSLNIVIGGNGLVGRSLKKKLQQLKAPCIGTYHKREEPDLLFLDITNFEKLNLFLKRYQPNTIFFCANLAGGVNFCEKQPKVARSFHYESIVNIVQFCKINNAKLVFISTDYVFDGKKQGFTEEDIPKPLNIYGRLKYEAEQHIQNNLSQFLIIRTMNIYGWDPHTASPNYMMQVHRAVTSKKEFSVPSYLIGQPTYVEDLTCAITTLCSKNLGGVYHVVGPEPIDRYQWALAICDKLQLDSTYIRKKEDQHEDVVSRPLVSVMSTKKLNCDCGIALHSVEEGLDLLAHDFNLS